MGPQPFGCGRYEGEPTLDKHGLLQWGRNLSVAEGSTETSRPKSACALQWGRNLSVAEGAALSAKWPPAPALQWGRNLSVAEGTGRILV